MTKVNSFSTSEDNRGAPVKSMGENKRVRSTLLVHTAGHAVGQNPKNDGARKGDFVMRGGFRLPKHTKDDNSEGLLRLLKSPHDKQWQRPRTSN